MLSQRQDQELLRLKTKLQNLDMPKFADKIFLPLHPPARGPKLFRWIQDTLEKPLHDPEKLRTLTKSQREKVQVCQGQLREIFSEMLKVLRNENDEYTRSDS